MVIGLGLLLGAVALALLRGKLKRMIGALVLGFAIGIAPRVVDWITDDKGVEDFIARIEPLVVVLGLLVAAYLLGRMSVEWPERVDSPES
jgi:hypothetical protein